MKRFRYLAILLIILTLWAGIKSAGRADETGGLKLSVEPVKQIFSSREGLVAKLTFKAKSKTKLCLAKDILSQLQLGIFRGGAGRLALKPLVLQDNSQIFQEPMKVLWLESGESLTVRANLKRYQFENENQWVPGEYTVDAAFNLCEQTPDAVVTDPGKETLIKASRRAWFMIMN